MSQLLKDGMRPLVLVPGFLGTWKPAAAPNGKIDPVTRVYDNLLDGLVKIGYVPGVTLFAFPFDWRLGLEELGGKLADFIGQVRQLGDRGKFSKGDPIMPGQREAPLGLNFMRWANLGWFDKKYDGPRVDYSKVDIIAHSMGGLVARAYIQGKQYAGDVARFMMLSTPNRGLMAAYYAMEGGDSTKIGIPLDVARNMLGIISFFEQGFFRFGIPSLVSLIKGKYQADLYQAFSTMPSVRDLLPDGSANYLYSLVEGQENTNPCGYPENSTLVRLNQPESLEVFDTLEGVWNMVSGGYQTRFRAQVEDKYSSTRPLWQHGQPFHDQPPANFEPGDTLVSVRCGRLPLPDARPDGAPWKVKQYLMEVDKIVGHPVNHVEICYDPPVVRLILGCLLSETAGEPYRIGQDTWDRPSIDMNKVNYLGLFT